MIDPSLTSSFFKGNRDRLFKSLSADILIITASGLIQKSADQAFPFRQDSNFWYLTGINEPDLILVKTKNEEFIIVPDFYIERQAVIQPIDKDSITSISDIDEILGDKDGWQKIRSYLASDTKIATLMPSPVMLKHYGIYANPARRQLVAKLKRLYPKASIIDMRAKLAAQRMVKQPLEIDIIQRAIDITTDTLKEVLATNSLVKYKDSGEIEEALLSGFVAKGGQGHAFDPIVASGKNAALIHYSKLAQPLKPNELIVCDVGSLYSFYSADITRTVSYGQPSSRQQAVFDAVSHVQNEAYKLIKPGIKAKDYEEKVENLIGEQLKDLELIKTINHKDVRKYYPHACSHSLGLDTHDSADYSLPLPENMVMTVEPGIYIKEEGIGVRIEDVIQITKDGCRVMSSSLPINLKL